MTSSSSRSHSILLLCSALAFSHYANAQDAAAPPPTLTYDQALMQAAAGEQQFSNGYASVGYSPAILTIPDRPFTAQRIYQEWARSGSNSQPIITTTVTIARDKVGRIHYESSRDAGQVTVMISDPVQHLNYRYDVPAADPANPTANSCTQPQMNQISGPATAPDPASSSPQTPDPNAPAPAVADPPLPIATTQELGLTQMQGTTAYGQQRTDYLSLQPGVKSMQTLSWFSPDLGLNLLEVSDYSGQNKFAVSTQAIAPGDPDPSLFAVPQGYTVPGTTQSCIPLMN